MFASRPGGASGVAWHRLDIRAPACVARVIADVAPSVVVNASSSEGRLTPTAGTRGAAAVEQGCRLVHVSSDAVFSVVI